MYKSRLAEVLAWGMWASSAFRTSGGKSCLPQLLMVPGTGKKGRQQGCASRLSAAVFSPEGAEASLPVREPSLLPQGRRQVWGGVDWLIGPGVKSQGKGAFFGAVTGAWLSDSQLAPCDFWENMQKLSLTCTPTSARTSMKRSREFSSPLNGRNLSWAQKELFIRCSQHSACRYRAQCALRHNRQLSSWKRSL